MRVQSNIRIELGRMKRSNLLRLRMRAVDGVRSQHASAQPNKMESARQSLVSRAHSNPFENVNTTKERQIRIAEHIHNKVIAICL